MRRLANILGIVLFSFSVSACESMKGGVGALLGGAGGAAIGSQFGKGTGQLVAIAIGTLAGAWAGSEIGKSLDRADRLASQKATHDALESSPTGKTVVWKNPDTGNSGKVTPTTTSNTREAGSRPCREFEQSILVDGKRESAYGRACRERDGTWKIVN